MPNIILASKSKVRKEILDNHNINSKVEASNVDEDPIKESLLKCDKKFALILMRERITRPYASLCCSTIAFSERSYPSKQE